MAREDFVPRANDAFLAEHDQYKAGMTTHGTTLGFSAAEVTAVGTDNTAMGYQTLYFNSTGGANAAFGKEALYYATGSDNTAFGFRAGYNNTGNAKWQATKNGYQY